MTATVHVRAPCRLHFGMFSFGRNDRPAFGGVGVMVEPPAVEVAIRPANQFAVAGSLAERAKHFAMSAAKAWGLPKVPRCEIRVQSPNNHVGLGIGTQLALSVAAGMRSFLRLPELPAAQLAAAVGRATRSAIGTYGFRRGGLIVDAGHAAGESIGSLHARVALPEAWRFVLVCPNNQRGLAGASEADAFEQLPPVPDRVTQELWRITENEILPAAERSDCRGFGDAVYRFGRLAGECFAAVQGGPFANSHTEKLIERLRSYGVAGVGQSSWGPTVFAVCASEAEAQTLSEWGRQQEVDCDVTIARPNNWGMRMEE